MHLSFVVRLAQVSFSDGFTKSHRCLRLRGHSGGNLHCVFCGLAHHLGDAGDRWDLADLRRSVAELHLKSFDVGANSGELLFAHKPDSSHSSLNFGADQSHHEFTVGAALVDEVFSDELELLGKLFRRTDT